MVIKAVSFDLDGTLIDFQFDNVVWKRLLPEVYAKEKLISIKNAKKEVCERYQILLHHNQWTNLTFWYQELGLKGKPETLLYQASSKLRWYADTSVLPILAKKYPLYIITQSPKMFVQYKLKGKTRLFKKIYSVTDDFKQLKKDREIYKTILQNHACSPNEWLHLGDHYEFDYAIPRQVGIHAIFLDRSKNKKEFSSETTRITTLKQLPNAIKRIETSQQQK
ncbi:MAG: HAD family hydrolase [Candidatus Woesearchaeota archaeon]